VVTRRKVTLARKKILLEVDSLSCAAVKTDSRSGLAVLRGCQNRLAKWTRELPSLDKKALVLDCEALAQDKNAAILDSESTSRSILSSRGSVRVHFDSLF
jgi:hypothetical protein